MLWRFCRCSFNTRSNVDSLQRWAASVHMKRLINKNGIFFSFSLIHTNTHTHSNHLWALHTSLHDTFFFSQASMHPLDLRKLFDQSWSNSFLKINEWMNFVINLCVLSQFDHYSSSSAWVAFLIFPGWRRQPVNLLGRAAWWPSPKCHYITRRMISDKTDCWSDLVWSCEERSNYSSWSGCHSTERQRDRERWPADALSSGVNGVIKLQYRKCYQDTMTLLWNICNSFCLSILPPVIPLENIWLSKVKTRQHKKCKLRS